VHQKRVQEHKLGSENSGRKQREKIRALFRGEKIHKRPECQARVNVEFTIFLFCATVFTCKT